MCFGQLDTTEQKSTSTKLPAWFDNAAQYNVGKGVEAASRPFESYTAPRVAGLSGDENQAFGLLRSVAGSGNPYLSDIESMYGKFANSPAANISAPSVLGPNVDPRTASLQDYINPYVDATLTPQLYDIDKKAAQDRMAGNSRAIFSGAYGDARHGIESAKTTDDRNRLRESVIGKAYSDAFGAGSGLRLQDIMNLISTQGANAQLGETALQRSMAGGTALRDLDKYSTGRAVDLSKAQAEAGATARGIEQKGLDTDLQEFMRRQGYPAEMSKLLTSILAGTPHGQDTVTTTEKPNNTGWQAIGSLLGSFI